MISEAPAEGLLEVLIIPCVWHRGAMVLADKKSESQAGNGFAVSLAPSAWKHLAELAGPVFRLEKPRARFAHMQRCLQNPALMSSVWTWALAEGYVSEHDLHRLDYSDSAPSQSSPSLFLLEDEALAQYEAFRDAGHFVRYTRFSGYVPLERMRMEMIQTRLPLDLVSDFACFLYLQSVFPSLDGVWWSDCICSQQSFTPHGAIFLHQLASWRKTCEENEAESYSACLFPCP